ncbi:sensor domain-containing diguanylate cyclase [Variovorax sp. RHLX14]|uniref:sensor domain-containing diguanylate cyclase n=1 Tax=Variovorax sp. RHLX14 TaxID=1259731 RepID=UPI003F47A10C
MQQIFNNSRSIQRRAIHAATVFVVFVCLSLLIVDVWLALKARQHELNQTIISNTNLTAAVAQELDGIVSEVGNLLESIAFELDLGSADPQTIDHLQPILKHHAEKNKHVHGIFVYDTQGNWLINSQGVYPLKANNADRDYFIYHLGHPSLAIRIGKPIVSRSTGKWIIPVSQRLNDKKGMFAGVVLATIEVAHIRSLLEGFNIGRQGSLTFALQDGTILVRRPFAEENMGKALVGGRLQSEFISSSSGNYELVSLIDGIERLGSFRHTPNHPLLVTVAVSKEEMLEDWRKTTALQTVWILLLCIITAVAGGYIVRSVRQRAKVELSLGETRDELTKSNARLSQLASHDGLTGLANRRSFDEILDRDFSESLRSGNALGLIMIDVDHFKKYNDLYGHPQGDRCLQQVALAVQSTARRPMDFVARYGGEEIVMVLPATDTEGVHVVAEAARAAVESLKIIHSASSSGFVTICAGVAVRTANSRFLNAEELLQNADEALYRAKESGRNKVAT